MSKVSVIIPVYNVEKYLRECLDSVINQTLKDIEIICVNDGSTDNSRDILEDYSQRDYRVRIIDKKNGGLSSARNAGMKAARGEFLSFIDSDDWIDSMMLEKLYKSIQDNDSDISICAVHLFDETTKCIDDSSKYYTLEVFDESFDNRAFSYKDTKPFIMDVCIMAWNKLYRRSLIEQYGAEFPEGLIFEDGPFFFSIFFKTERISIVRDFLYYYRINRKNSIIQKAGKKFLDIIDVAELMYEKIKDLEDFEDIRYTFFAKKIEDFIYRFEHLKPKYKRKFAEKLKKESSLVYESMILEPLIHGKLMYNYFMFKNLITGSLMFYEIKKFKIKSMYKVIEILYKEQGVYFLKYKKHIIRLKKHPDIFDIYYDNDKIIIKIFKKLKFRFPFKYSKLERFHAND